MESSDPLSPTGVRSLRGSLTRAAFAIRLGVTAQTVYRWELPFEAKESRRPRASERGRLLTLLGVALPPLDNGRGNQDRDEAAALPAFEQILRGNWHHGESELLNLLAADVAPSGSTAALAAVGLALVEALQRGSARRALGALTPALRAEGRNELPRHIALWVNATAALIYSLPDARLFDLGRVHARVARVEEAAAAGEDRDPQFLAALAALQASLLMADEPLVMRALSRGQNFERESLSPFMALHLEELRGWGLLFAGQAAQAAARFQEVAERAGELGASLLEARAYAYLAIRHLEDLADPEQAISSAHRALAVAERARLAPCIHTIFCARALIESNLRLGRMDAAQAAVAGIHAYVKETGMAAFMAAPTLSRLYALSGQGDKLIALRDELLAWDTTALGPTARAFAAGVEAKRLFMLGGDLDAIVTAFAKAEADASRWSFLLREILVYHAGVLVLAGRGDEARLVMRRASRLLDRSPSPWAAAHLLRIEGMLFAFQGDWAHGRKLIDAAIATFQAAQDLPDVLIATYIRACIANTYGEASAPEERLAAEAALRAAGMEVSAAVQTAAPLFQMRHAPLVLRDATDVSVESLVVPLKRLAVRGSGPALVLRELFTLSRTLLPRRAIRLEELDRQGRALPIHVDQSSNANDCEWLEFGDGAGRRFRLGAQGPLESNELSALSIISVAASLSLEVAGLRGTGKAVDASSEDGSNELPGLIAVSKPMQRLRAEVFQLASSRATVIISGESGTGKEVVARALHDTSLRKDKPYVAFNCASVPRELFEGQLFGYKRGAFTGAVTDSVGVVRAAAGGTLFMDEIGELPLDVQPKLLRFLENGEVFSLGERRPTAVDVRIVAATHRDLGELVKIGQFREDLYYRLQVVPLRIPPLRERKEDILPLARHFLELLSASSKAPALAADACDALTAQHWPGNVRELRNVLERALAFAPVPEVLRRDHLRF